jgi:acetyltransferase-like isoleucine patch superfamily enzyme
VGQLKFQLRFALPIWFVSLITAWLPDNRVSIRLRGWLVSVLLPGRPKGFRLGRDVTLLGASRLHIGSNVYLAKGAWINALGGIHLGDEVVVGPYVVIVSTKHGFENDSVFQGGTHFSAVSIERGTWLAAHSTVSAGVKIGPGCLIAANSVVTKDIEANQIFGGVPAKFIAPRLNNPGGARAPVL